MDLIIAVTSASWWSSLVPTFVGGLTGGSFAVIAQIVANKLHWGAARVGQPAIGDAK
jgi:hypothetical protein